MELPLRVTRAVEVPTGLLKALKIDGEVVSVNAHLAGDERMYLLEVSSAQVLEGLNPDFAELAREEATAVIVTARSSQGDFDFTSRFFAPRLGIDEDPVTGSAHCYLTPYWAQKLNKNELAGYQASKRGGIVKCELRKDNVIVKGKAVTVLRGDLVNC
jgi:predicted PhzF superfamily epimerase YddE/YHI9